MAVDQPRQERAGGQVETGRRKLARGGTFPDLRDDAIANNHCNVLDQAAARQQGKPGEQRELSRLVALMPGVALSGCFQ